ncbi:RNA polymerase sigma factor [Actinomadura parmotrematis]|uniref:RNA polymerase sigma factor n=1 Tax=Actinomadura parmotrematis TaxID=2864039 RepID=A0ABS7FZG7_9ACTN|nr:RNA polymerase sigma factor [Actinomadura parmotrematis]MBW8485841.1 RNA polymerase sigma factor [Actinomadura parmotrematis]
MSANEARRRVEAVWRLESARIIAGLARLVRDVGLAEELAQDALVQALEQWPETGVPDNPGAWLTAVARRRGIDRIRREQTYARKLTEIGHRLETADDTAFDGVLDEEPIEDDVLRLVFTACHPVLPVPSRVALTLRMIGGLATDEIARAFLVPEATVAQRIVRAKKALAAAGVPFETPVGADRAARLASVLEVLYLVFNEGYAATAGDDLVRADLCREALRLGRVLAGLAPGEPEVHGLVALMEVQAARTRARTGPDGRPVPLAEQNRGQWDRLLIRRGVAALLRARGLGAAPGPYVLQAAIAVTHAQAPSFAETDWTAIAGLYELLVREAPSPVVELNRAVAVGMAHGPERGLEIVDGLAADLAGYHLLPSVRGDLLARLGRHDEARAEFARAAELTRNQAERRLLLDRADAP